MERCDNIGRGGLLGLGGTTREEYVKHLLEEHMPALRAIGLVDENLRTKVPGLSRGQLQQIHFAALEQEEYG